MISAVDALQRLREGNRRFVSGQSNTESGLSHLQRPNMSAGQYPFAVVLACSDSRVLTELLFDQGIGDLFVIRVAGNVVAPSIVGSVEYAVTQLGPRLLVVLGHSGCGAVTATLKELSKKAAHRSPNLRAIVDRIRPALDSVVTDHEDLESDDAVEQAVWANVGNSVQRMEHGSLIIQDLIGKDDLMIVGANYSIETGVVSFSGDEK